MRVRATWEYGPYREVTTAELLAGSAPSREGTLEQLDATVGHLTGVLAALIDRAGLTDREVLELVGGESLFDLESEA